MLISVVIPVFNRRDCVCRAIDSALLLDGQLAEVVVVDDGSTDGTAEVVLERFGRELSTRKVVLHRLAVNSGVTAAKNAGAVLSSGEWIVFLDSDDYILEESVADMVRELECAREFTLIFFRCVDSKGMLLGEAGLRSAVLSVRTYLRDWSWGECLPVMRAAVFPRYPYEPSLKGFEGLAYARLMRAQPGTVMVASIVARVYDTQRSDRISTAKGMMARAGQLSRGHWQVMVEFPRELGLARYALSIVKVGYYAVLHCVWHLSRLAVIAMTDKDIANRPR